MVEKEAVTEKEKEAASPTDDLLAELDFSSGPAKASCSNNSGLPSQKDTQKAVDLALEQGFLLCTSGFSMR